MYSIEGDTLVTTYYPGSLYSMKYNPDRATLCITATDEEDGFHPTVNEYEIKILGKDLTLKALKAVLDEETDRFTIEYSEYKVEFTLSSINYSYEEDGKKYEKRFMLGNNGLYLLYYGIKHGMKVL